MRDFTKTMPYSSEALVRLYKDTDSGHYFDRDTMRFFASRVTSNFARISDKVALFITTEKNFDGSKRFATVRRAEIVDFTREDGCKVSKVEIETVGEFNKVSLAKAKLGMKRLAWEAL